MIITGCVPEEKKLGLLAHSRVYLQLSRFEGFGLSVAEALALGLPVVISPGRSDRPVDREERGRSGGREPSGGSGSPGGTGCFVRRSLRGGIAEGLANVREVLSPRT